MCGYIITKTTIQYMPNYLNLNIEDRELILSPINKTFTEDILENNIGNVREFFIPFNSLQEVNWWVDAQIQKMEIGEKIELAVIERKNSQFVGMVSLDNLNSNTKTEPRIWIIPDKQNQEFGKKSLSMLISWYKSQPTPKKLHYIADLHNTSSQKLALSLGFSLLEQYKDENGDELVEYTM